MREHDDCIDAAREIARLFQESSQHYYAAEPNAGLSAAERGVELARKSNDLIWLRKCLTAQGILESDLHCVPRAYQSFSEALDVAHSVGEPEGLYSVYVNASAMLCYAGLANAGIAAAERASEYAHELRPDDQRNVHISTALANVAYGCIDSGQYARGLHAADSSIELVETCLSSDPINTTKLLLALSYKARLLLRANMVREAQEAIRRATRAQDSMGSAVRIDVYAGATIGLADVYSGQIDDGLGRLEGLLPTANQRGPVQLANLLQDLIEAHRVAQRHEVASRYLTELANHLAKTRSAAINLWKAKPGKWLNDLAPISLARRGTREIMAGQIHLQGDSQSALVELSAAAELYDDPSGRHPLRVGRMAAELADLIGIEHSAAAQIGQAAALHDIGKIGVPPAILLKPGPLSDAEREVVRSHCARGAELLASNQLTYGQMATAVARSHHEWWSGLGYPDGLRGTRIPLEARIATIADSFDALTHDRPYRPRISAEAALELMLDLGGRQFDPDLVVIFSKLVSGLLNAGTDLDSHFENDAGLTPFLQAQARVQSQIFRLGPLAWSREKQSR